MTTNAITVLVARLDAGWHRIDQEADPIRRRELEDFWISLLRQYERLCDDERPAQPRVDRHHRQEVAA
jgi:hypothetical protein